MRIALFTAFLMVRRAALEKRLVWVSVFIVVSGLILSRHGRVIHTLVSTLVITPHVFFLTDWEASRWKRGLIWLTGRTGGHLSINTAEVMLPFLCGTLLCSAAALAAFRGIPWQYWLVTPLSSLSFSLLYLASERHVKYQGRFFLSIVWIAGLTLSSSSGQLERLLLFTGYPGETLCCIEEAVSPHPDTFVLASIVYLALSSGVYTLSQRSRAARALSE